MIIMGVIISCFFEPTTISGGPPSRRCVCHSSLAAPGRSGEARSARSAGVDGPGGILRENHPEMTFSRMIFLIFPRKTPAFFW